MRCTTIYCGSVGDLLLDVCLSPTCAYFVFLVGLPTLALLGCMSVANKFEVRYSVVNSNLYCKTISK